MLRRIIAFVFAAVLMAALGSLAQTWFVQQAWLEAAAMSGGTPAELPLAERLSWMLDDVVGLQPLYSALTTSALLVSFLAAGLVARFTGLRTIVFAVAGGVAIFVMFTLMKNVLGTVGVFGARGPMGLGVQAFAGVLSGLLFAWLSQPRADS
jgi:hypothetical protein